MKSISKMIMVVVMAIFAFTTFGQSVTDHNSKDVFVVHSISGLSSAITSSSAKLNYSVYDSSSIRSYYFSSNDTPDGGHYIHVTDGSGVNFDLSVKNLPQSFDKFLSSQNQPTIGVGGGYVFNSILNFNDWSVLKRLDNGIKPQEFEAYLGGFVNTSLVQYYDTINQKVIDGKKEIGKFVNFGLNGDATLYYARWFAIALTGYASYGVNMDGLKSFQRSSSQVYNTNPSVIQVGQIDGKIGGDASNKTLNGRVSVAFPIFLKAMLTQANRVSVENFQNDLFSKLFVLPSFAAFGSLNSHWTRQIGASLNVLGKGYGGVNSTVVPAFGVGLDWQSDNSTHTGWAVGSFYITGTINVGKIVERSKHPEESSHTMR